MPSTEVQRTLVKSPPELWAELSDPAALARHLAELGEIQLTRVEPESAVEWEAENVKGSVQLKASGWGTKVTFSLTRELPEQTVAEPEPTVVAPEPRLAEPVAVEPEPPLAEPELLEPDPVPDPEPERIPRRNFFARLFKRRRKEPVAEMPEPSEVLSEPEVPQESEPVIEGPPDDLAQADTQHEPQAETTEEPPDLAAELQAIEQAMVEQDTALLTAVLDRLGAAHHRPFSRG